MRRCACIIRVPGLYCAAARPSLRPLHEALVRTHPDQLLWGNDWPHPRRAKDMPDDGHLLDRFNAWTPNAATREKILVSNPAALYGFYWSVTLEPVATYR